MGHIDELLNYSKTEEGRALIRENIELTNEFTTFVSTLQTKLSEERDSLNYEWIIKCFRILRNSCCNDIDSFFVGQLMCNGLLFDCIGVSRDLVLKSASDDTEKQIMSDTSNDTHSIVLACCQLVANFSANGELAIDFLFSNSGQDLVLFKDLLAMCTVCRNSKITAAILASIYNSIRGSSGGGFSRLSEVISNRPLMCQLLLIVVDSSYKSGSYSEQESDEVMEWFHIIGLLLVRECKILTAFEVVKSTLNNSFTYEQLILLQLTLSVLEDSSCSTDLVFSFKNRADEWKMLLTCLSQQICSIDMQEIMRTTTKSEELAATECDAQSISMPRDFFSISLQIISTSLSVFSDCQECVGLKARLLQENVVKVCCDAIASHHVGARISEKRNYKPAAEASEHEESVKHIVKDVLQFLGNFVYKFEEGQNFLRECGGLATVLSYCATDFSNPLTREWALLCVRNATLDNYQNQEFIESLRPQSVSIQDEKMKEQGMNVELDTKTGKFKFTQTPK